MYVYSGSKNEETVYFFVYSYQINILDYTRDRHNTDNRYLGYRPSGNQSQSTGSPTSSRTVQFRPRLLWRLVVPYTKIAISVHQIVRRRPNPNRPWTTNSHDPNRSACCIPTYWVNKNTPPRRRLHHRPHNHDRPYRISNRKDRSRIWYPRVANPIVQVQCLEEKK